MNIGMNISRSPLQVKPLKYNLQLNSIFLFFFRALGTNWLKFSTQWLHKEIQQYSLKTLSCQTQASFASQYIGIFLGQKFWCIFSHSQKFALHWPSFGCYTLRVLQHLLAPLESRWPAAEEFHPSTELTKIKKENLVL